MSEFSIDNYRRQIEGALDYADETYTFDDVKEAIEAGRMQFWPGAHSAVVTEILTYPRYKVLNIFLAGGRMSEIEQMAPAILGWGKSLGCKKAVLTGRRGWTRSFLTRTGWANSNLEVLSTEL